MMTQINNTSSAIDIRFLLECDNHQFLVESYMALLGRKPDRIGLAHYAQRLQTGIPRQVIIAEIWHIRLTQDVIVSASSEMKKLMARYYAVRGLPLGKMRWRLLPRFGARIPDASEFDWVHWAANYTDTHYQVKKSLSHRNTFAMSKEGSRFNHIVLPLADVLALPDEAFIEQLYRTLLRREADDTGMVQYLSALLDGQDRLHVLQDLYQSEEATQVRTLSDLDEVADDSYLDAIYQRLLGRMPDPVGKHSYQSLITAGRRKEVVASIKASSEYQQRNAHRVIFESELEGTLRQWSPEKPVREFSDAPLGSYLRWIDQYEKLSVQDRKSLEHRAKGWTEAPLFTVVINSASNTNSGYLDEAIQSVRDQVYFNWKLVVAVSSNSDTKTEEVLRNHLDAESRIRIERLFNLGDGLPEVCSKILEKAKSGYILFLDSADKLAETALFWMAETLRNHPECRMLYSDEDTISADGVRNDPYFKPDYNYELHLAQDLMGRTCVFETELLRGIGGYRPGFAGAEYWDVSLRALENLKFHQITHIPRVLYHRRHDLTRPTEETRLRVVQEHLQRKGIEGTVVSAPDASQYNRVVYQRPSVQPSVTIIIPTRDHADLLQRCIDSIRQKSTYQNYDIFVVDNGSNDKATLDLLKKLDEEKDIRVERMDIPFNFAILNNAAAAKTSSDLLCFLNDDTEILTPDWLEEMSAFATQEDIGIVGARLWYPDGRLQHAGVITGIHGLCDHIFKGLKRGNAGYFGRAVLHQSLSAVTGACMMVRRSVFAQAGGFNEFLAISLNDIDLCLKIQSLNYRNVWTPYAELVHHESVSRGLDSEWQHRYRKTREIMMFISRWYDKLYNDHAYNMNISLQSIDCSCWANPPRQTRTGVLSPVTLARTVLEQFPIYKEAWMLAAGIFLQENDRLRRENGAILQCVDALKEDKIAIRNNLLQLKTDVANWISTTEEDLVANQLKTITEMLEDLIYLSDQAAVYIDGRKGWLRPANMIGGSLGKPTSWHGSGNDPYFLVKVENEHHLGAGWYRVQLIMISEHTRINAKIYLDYGSGFSEADSIILPTYTSEPFERIIHLSKDVQTLRFDPQDDKGDFTVESLRIDRIDEADAKTVMLQRVINQEQYHEQTPREQLWAEILLKAQEERNEPVQGLLARYNETFVIWSSQDIAYEEWIEKVEAASLPTSDMMRKTLANTTYQPLISIVIPVYNTQESYLRACIDSVLAQAYINWELCIADDCSSKPYVIAILQEYEKKDDRIRVVYRKENGHIARASNSALEIATGEYVGFLDHDDTLSEYALYFMVEAINKHNDSVIFYSDEDIMSKDGQRIYPHFKSDWNPDLLFSHNYITHFCLYKKNLLLKVSGFREGVDGAQDYDLLLRCLPYIRPEQIIHIPRVLYHWRAIEGSTALRSDEKNYTVDAGRRALEDYFFQNGPVGTIILKSQVIDNTYRVIWPIPQPKPLVSLLIPTRDKKALTEQAVLSILAKTIYDNYEIIILDNGSEDDETLDWFVAIQKKDERIRVIRYDYPFNYSAINNFGVGQSKGSIIGLINNDIEVISQEWLTEMVSHACRPEIGCVGAKLYYSNDTIQHGGIILSLGGLAAHSHRLSSRESPGYFGRLTMVQNLSAVTGACLLVRKEIYDAVGGLDQNNLKVAYNDVDFCLKVKNAGYRNIWTPYAELYHYESISRGREDTPEKLERFQKESQYMKSKWGSQLDEDPYYNQNLTKVREDFSIGFSSDLHR